MTKRIAIGFIAGLASGFFASGGGLLLVPAFVYFFYLSDKEARATSIYAILPMVINTESFAVEITPGEIPFGHYDTVATKLAGMLGISKFDIDRKVPKNSRRSFNSFQIKTNV